MRIALIAAAILLGAQPASAGDTYGAIAVDPNNGAFGYSTGASDQLEAEGIALANCIAEGDNCEIAIWFKNGCGAVAAANNGAWGSGWGGNPEIAQNHAIRECQQNGGANCSTQVYYCSSE